MISDNYVTGDNIYLRELQNFFFEVLGMMSITHYGAVGDGRRDNYGPIQVAIDDAIRRGLSFLYVPYGKFIYTGEFTNLIDPDTGKQRIIFMGNPHAHIVNIRTGEEIEIHQFGWCDCEGEDYYTKEEADGRFVNASGDTMTGPLAIGSSSTASGDLSFAQGESTASGNCSHAEGYQTEASGPNSHAEGQSTTASGRAAHAEGGNAVASGHQSHCEGWNNAATYFSSHAEGTGVRSVSQSSHAEGFATVARGRAQHAEGQYNIIDTTTEEDTATRGAYIHIAGNGPDDGSYRSNAHTLDWSGNAWFAGEVYVGSTSGTNKDEGSKKLISEADLQAFATLNGLQMPS